MRNVRPNNVQNFTTLYDASKRIETIFIFSLYYLYKLSMITDFTTFGVKPQNETIFHMLFIARVGCDENFG